MTNATGRGSSAEAPARKKPTARNLPHDDSADGRPDNPLPFGVSTEGRPAKPRRSGPIGSVHYFLKWAVRPITRKLRDPNFRIRRPRLPQISKPNFGNGLKRLTRPIARKLRDAFLRPAIQQFRDCEDRIEARLRDMDETVRMTDRTLLGLGLGLAALQAPRGGRRLVARPTRLYVDMRCLQDLDYAYRGIGFHTAGVLRHFRQHRGCNLPSLGLIDPNLPKLPAEYAALVDGTTANLLPAEGAALVLHPSPMTHDGSWLAAMFSRPDILHAALFYDAIPLEEPQRYLPTPAAHRAYMNNLVWLRSVDYHYPISATSAQRLRELVGCPAENVRVSGACLRSAFTGLDRAVPQNGPFADHRYFLMVGGGDTRKNVEIVLDAHAGLNSDTGIVVGGHYEDDHIGRLRSRYIRAGGKSANLHFAKGSTDAQLAALYHRALATVVPSRSEGFSLPLAEALACECPVIASNIPAHRELVSMHEAFFEPSDRAAIAAKMRLFADDPTARGRWLQAQGAERVSNAEEDVAARVWSHLGEQLPIPVPRPLAPAGAVSLSPAKPRIAFLTPLPPDRSGVADYSEQCLKALAKYAEIDVYTDTADCRRDPDLRGYFAMSEYPYLTRDYDRVVSVIANSEYHRNCIDMVVRHGGPCISHDARMYNYYIFSRGDKAFSENLSRWLKRPVDPVQAWEWCNDQTKLPTLCFEEILPKAEPFIVHSRGNQSAIERQYGVKPALVPFSPYRSFADAEVEPDARRLAKARLGFARDTVIIASFGIAAETKAPLQCLDALKLVRAAGIAAELHFVGSDGGIAERWDGWVRERGLEGRAHFANRWIGEATYRDYAAAADVAVQLRTHRFGSISGALADCIAAGIPTVANADLADALDAPDYVLRTGDELEPAAIAERLCEAITIAARERRPEESRQAYLACRNFDAYSRELLRVLGLA